MDDEREIQQVLARYVRATDRRDGAAMSKLFFDDGVVEIFSGQAAPASLGRIEGAAAIGQAVSTLMAPHPLRGWSHHTTHDSIIEVAGGEATIDTQFVVFNTLGAARPESGWRTGTVGPQGSVTPVEAGYYSTRLARDDGNWKIVRHHIILDLPHAFPDE